MLAAIRSFAQTLAAKVLLAVVALSFVIYGISGSLRGGTASNAVITAGGRSVSPAEFKQIFNNQKAQIEQQTGQTLSDSDVIATGFPQRLARAYAAQTAFAAWTDKVHLRASDGLVANALKAIPAIAANAFDRITGKFSKTAYLQFLAANNMTQATFEQGLRDEIVANHFEAATMTGLRTPQAYGALQAAVALEGRDVSWFVVDAKVAGVPPKPTDADLKAFIGRHEAQLRHPDMRVLSLAVFTKADAAKTATVDPAEVQKLYAFEKDTLSQPEKRTFVQVTAKDTATAAKIAAALKSGQAIQAVAAANGANAIPYAYQALGSVPDPVVGKAVFAMKPGDVSGPINGALGVSVVKLTGVAPGRTVSFEEAKPALEQKLREQNAGKQVYAEVQAFTKAREAGTPMLQAAKQAGAKIINIPPISADGVAMNGQPLRLPKPVLDAARTLPKGGDSDIAQAGQGDYFAVHVDDLIPSALPPTTDPRLPFVWLQEQMDQRMSAKAAELMARVKKGESLDAVAKSAGAEVQHSLGVTRATNDPKLGQGFTGEVFTGDQGGVFMTAAASPGYVIGHIDALHTPDLAKAAQFANVNRRDITTGVAKDLLQEARDSAFDVMKTKVYSDRINAAIGGGAAPAAPAQ